MLSDESSSDSETGRFKSHTEKQDEKSSSKKEDGHKHSGRNRPSVSNNRSRREIDLRRNDRTSYIRRSRERHRHTRYSPPNRKSSKDRSPGRRRSLDRHRHDRRRERDYSSRSNRPVHHRSRSRDAKRHSRSQSHKPPEVLRDLRDEITRNTSPKKESDNKRRERKSSSPQTGKRSEIHKPDPVPQKKKADSPIVIDEHDTDKSDEVQPGSYYKMIPAAIKKNSEDDSSEIDSSDDEKLRAKLLNLEKELQETKKKKHKRKHKKKRSKSKDRETSATVEVSSTTDIDKVNTTYQDVTTTNNVEVTSTQKNVQKESSEEGEILSDDDLQVANYDPNDLRHKLKRSLNKVDITASPEPQGEKVLDTNVCGPALPPHLKGLYEGKSTTPEYEGPALPPNHLAKKNMGPTIPENMKKVLAENIDVKHVSSDEDTGIGPLPAGSEDKMSNAHKQLEERALEMKIRQLQGDKIQKSDVKSREQWMLELPEAKAKILGLEARTFRAKEGPDMSDRSSWTDTPEEKARKAAGIVKDEEDADVILKREARSHQIASRDKEQEMAVKKHKKKHKRDESLLEMHQKKLKKKKKKEDKDEKKERRPFSRDVDLQVNRFDEAQKKSVIKRAQELDSRFSKGEAKYL